MTKLLPIGVENFEDFSRQNYYYIDKTMFIAELLYNRGKVNLFTRPRRFGKTLMMSMLRTFFEIGRDQSMFDGLNIFQEKELCDKYMGQFPVISITMKSIDGDNYQEAIDALRAIIGTEAMRFQFLDFLALAFPCTGAYKVCNSNGPLYYNLDMIISLGYRIRSVIATHFRRWATERLKEYIIKGFTMDDERLKGNGGGAYWRELLDRIRDIRSSVKNDEITKKREK